MQKITDIDKFVESNRYHRVIEDKLFKVPVKNGSTMVSARNVKGI